MFHRPGPEWFGGDYAFGICHEKADPSMLSML
jgi:hypothetical protein